MHRTKLLGRMLLGAVALGACLTAGYGQEKTFLGKTSAQWAANLTSADAASKRGAAFALGKLGYSGSVYIPQLLQLVQTDPDPTVKDVAANAVGEICKATPGFPPESWPTIVEAMNQALSKDADPGVKRSAAFALGCLGAKAQNALTTLDRVLSDPKSTPAVKQNVAWALGQIGGTTGVLTLTKALKETDPYVIRDAAKALEKMGRKIAEGPERVQVVLALQPHLNHTDTEVKKAILQALVPILAPADAAALAEPLDHLVNETKEHAEVRLNAALALGNIGGEKAGNAVPFLVQVLQGDDLDMRRQAAAVIGNIGTKALPAVAALRKALKDKDLVVRQNAATSLGGIGIPMNPALEKNKNKADDPERVKITAAVPDLIEVLGNPMEHNVVRMAAAIALKEIGRCAQLDAPRATDVLIETVANNKNSPDLRARTLWPLRFHSNVEKLDKLFSALNHIVDTEPVTNETKDLRYDAAYLLSRYKKKDVSNKVLDTILEFLKDSQVFIATGTKGSATAGGAETGPGGTKVEITKGSDGRIIALQAVNFIINEMYGGESKKVLDRMDIMTQLDALANAAKIDPDVKGYAQKVLKYLRS